MKAKEYAAQYLKSEDKYTTIVEISRSFLNEIDTISNARNAKLASALVPICRELNQKWQKFASIVNSKLPVSRPIAYWGFKNLVKEASPELYILCVNESVW